MKNILLLVTVAVLCACQPSVKMEFINITDNSSTLVFHYKNIPDEAIITFFAVGSNGGALEWRLSNYNDCEIVGTDGTDSIHLKGLKPFSQYNCRCSVYDCDSRKETVLQDVSFMTECYTAGATWVDLGLSVMWFSVNLGASTPYECGDAYAWGECETKKQFEGFTYTYLENYRYGVQKSIGKFSLPPQNDVATQNLGDGARMPSVEEVNELIERCEWSLIETPILGKNRYLVTGPNGNSITFVTDGSYWTRDLYEHDKSEDARLSYGRFTPKYLLESIYDYDKAYAMDFHSVKSVKRGGRFIHKLRYSPGLIRPVKEK